MKLGYTVYRRIECHILLDTRDRLNSTVVEIVLDADTYTMLDPDVKLRLLWSDL